MPSIDLSRLQAFWIDRTAVALPPQYFRTDWTYSLLCSDDGSLASGTNGATSIPVSVAALHASQAARYPYLTKWAVFRVPAAAESSLVRHLKGQTALAGWDGSGAL